MKSTLNEHKLEIIISCANDAYCLLRRAVNIEDVQIYIPARTKREIYAKSGLCVVQTVANIGLSKRTGVRHNAQGK